MLSCSQVAISYASKYTQLTVLSALTLEVPSGALAIMGPSGSGKSSLLRCLAGLQVPSQGSITLDGIPIDPRGDARAAMVFQDHRLIEFLSVAENLALAAELRGRRLTTEQIDELLADVGLSGFGLRMPVTLSGGQAQRVAIARAVAARPRLLLADEPTGALDRLNSRLIGVMLARLCRERDMILVVATHDSTVADSCDAIVDLGSNQEAA